MAKKDFLIAEPVHEFAIFYEDPLQELKFLGPNKLLWVVQDAALVHRILNVLRLKKGNFCIIFSKYISIRFMVGDIAKKKVMLLYQGYITPCATSLHPIRILLPLLKRDALETTIYNLVELGVHEIILISTTNSRSHWSVAQEPERIERVIISAMEQAKHFNWPIWRSIIVPMNFYLEMYHKETPHFYADPEGGILRDVLVNTQLSEAVPLTLLVGPESGLTNSELELLRLYRCESVALTTGVLRAQQAATVFAGIFCSWYSSR